MMVLEPEEQEEEHLHHRHRRQRRHHPKKQQEYYRVAVATTTTGTTAVKNNNNNSCDEDDNDDYQNDDDNEEPNNPNTTTSTKIITNSTYLYTFCAALNSCNLGYDIGVSTNTGPLIQTYFQLSDKQIEIFLGSINFWSIFGALLISPYVSDKYGRRCTFAIASIGFLIGITIMSLSQSYTQLLIGRTIIGLGVGTGEAIDPMYISEIAPPSQRGYLVSWAEAGVSLGVVLGFLSSLVFWPLLDSDPNVWRYMLALGGIMPLIILGLVWKVMAESPRWLLTKGLENEARSVLERTTTTTNDNSSSDSGVDDIIKEIELSLELERAASAAASSNNKSGGNDAVIGWKAILLNPSPAIRRMLTVGIGMAIIQQAVGIDSIMFYLVYVIRGTGVTSEMGQLLALVVLGTIKLLFVFVGAKLIDTVGRRKLLFTSLIGCAVSLVVVSLTFMYDDDVVIDDTENDENNSQNQQQHWSQMITVIALGFYLAFFSSGLGPGNWVVISEIFATSIRAKAMSIAIFPNRVTATIMASTFLSLADLLTWPGFFLALAGVCMLSCLFLYVYLPETKGKTLEEMSHYFAEVTGDRTILDAEERLMMRIRPSSSNTDNSNDNSRGLHHHYDGVSGDDGDEGVELAATKQNHNNDNEDGPFIQRGIVT